MSDVVCGCLAGGRAGLPRCVQPKHRIGSNDPVDTRVYPKSCLSHASSGGVDTTRMLAVAFDLNRVDASAQVARFERSAASAPPIDAHGATLPIAVHDELACLLGPLSTGLVVERERRGRVQIGGFSLQGLAVVVPELNVLLAPYLFESVEEVDFVTDHYLTPAFRELFAAKDMELLQWAEVGWTHIYGLTPILTPEDAGDRPMRASNAIGSQIVTEAIGADSTPVTFSEVIPSLQTGLIESGQTGVGMYAIAGISREARHFTLTYHAFDTGVIVANRAWYQALTERKRRLVTDALDPVQFGRDEVRRVLAAILTEQLPAQSVTIHQLNESQRRRWRDALADTHEALLDRIGGQAREIYGRVQAGKREWASRHTGDIAGRPTDIRN